MPAPIQEPMGLDRSRLAPLSVALDSYQPEARVKPEETGHEHILFEPQTRRDPSILYMDTRLFRQQVRREAPGFARRRAVCPPGVRAN
ncbi:MAG TPA: hypothetical protein VN044_09450, partial [Verrucomicrobiae bacterium]|nr:hypothetical protein [Verrucomicrobiae bacterium]